MLKSYLIIVFIDFVDCNLIFFVEFQLTICVSRSFSYDYVELVIIEQICCLIYSDLLLLLKLSVLNEMVYIFYIL